MSTKEPAANSSIDGSATFRRIDAKRFARALSPSLEAERVSEGLYRVESGDESYTVELGAGACDCADYQYRGAQTVCKHAIRSALTEAIGERARSFALSSDALPKS